MSVKRMCVFGATENIGGTERYILTLYESLDKTKIQFDLLMHHSTGEVPYEEGIVSSGGRIYREYYRNSERHLKGYISPKELLKKHPEWIAVYLNVQNIHTAYRLLVEAQRRHIPYRIIHAHNNDYSRKPSIKEKLYESYFNITKERVVTDFWAASSIAGKWMFKNSKFEVMPDAVDFEKFRMNDEMRIIMRKRYNIPDKTVVMGFCGRLVYQKNPEFLLEIFKTLKCTVSDSLLLVVGGGEKYDLLGDLAKNMNLTDYIIFTGSVSNVSDYMQMMDCFVLPSRYEGFGIVLLEAQAAGLRCFTSEGVVPRETNISGRVRFISGGDPNIWSDTIISTGFDRKDCMTDLQGSAFTVEALNDKFMVALDLI